MSLLLPRVTGCARQTNDFPVIVTDPIDGAKRKRIERGIFKTRAEGIGQESGKDPMRDKQGRTVQDQGIANKCRTSSIGMEFGYWRIDFEY